MNKNKQLTVYLCLEIVKENVFMQINNKILITLKLLITM